MDVNGKSLWQVAAGNGKETNYAKMCLDEGVIVFGPGRYGPWPDCRVPMLSDGWTTTKAGIIKRFAEELRVGDVVVLRVGTQQVYGVGEITGRYDFSEKFGNVQGWDLQHFRKVRWVWHMGGEPHTFPVYTLKLGSSVQRVISPLIWEWVASLPG